MTKLEDHIVVIDGKKYVPLEVAQAASYTKAVEELAAAKSLIKDAFKDFNNALTIEDND